jgi:hypothetical protein
VKWTRAFVAGPVTSLSLALLAYASATPVGYHPDEMAGLRLSWSARPERIEKCRQLTAEEQARREEHMRQRVECEGGFASYALRVELDGRVIGSSVFRGAGLRHDRPLYLLRDYAVPAGAHRVRISLTRRETTDNDAAAFARPVVPDADTGLFAGRAEREAAERARSARAALPPLLTLDTLVDFTARRVALVTFDAERRVLQVRGAPAVE